MEEKNIAFKFMGMVIGICTVYFFRGFVYALGAYVALKLFGII